MAFILKPNYGQDIMINRWNWYPTVELMVREGLLTKERAEVCRFNGCGSYITGEEADCVSVRLDSLLKRMRPGEHLLMDGTVTDVRKEHNLPSDESPELDWDNVFSASFEWLSNFRDFCRTCNGFKIV